MFVNETDKTERRAEKAYSKSKKQGRKKHHVDPPVIGTQGVIVTLRQSEAVVAKSPAIICPGSAGHQPIPTAMRSRSDNQHSHSLLVSDYT